MDGHLPRHRGILLGEVTQIEDQWVTVSEARPSSDQGEGSISDAIETLGGSSQAASGAPSAPLVPKAGMGVLFYQGDEQSKEQGGPIFDVHKQARGWRLKFAKPGPRSNAGGTGGAGLRHRRPQRGQEGRLGSTSRSHLSPAMRSTCR